MAVIGAVVDTVGNASGDTMGVPPPLVVKDTFSAALCVGVGVGKRVLTCADGVRSRRFGGGGARGDRRAVSYSNSGRVKCEAASDPSLEKSKRIVSIEIPSIVDSGVALDARLSACGVLPGTGVNVAAGVSSSEDMAKTAGIHPASSRITKIDNRRGRGKISAPNEERRIAARGLRGALLRNLLKKDMAQWYHH